MIHRLTIQFLPCQIAHNGNAHKQGLSNEEGKSAEVGNGKREVKTERDKEQREGGEEDGTEGGGKGRREGDGEKTVGRQTVHEFNASKRPYHCQPSPVFSTSVAYSRHAPPPLPSSERTENCSAFESRLI